MALHKKRKYHPRKWVDGSDPFYKTAVLSDFLNPSHGSARIIQVRTIHLLLCELLSHFVLVDK
jgi:hypothetical protein